MPALTFTVNSISRCSGSGNHYTLNVTVQGGPTVNFGALKSDMEVDFSSLEDARQAAIDRLRSAIKEAGAVTFAQVQTALEGKTFKL